MDQNNEITKALEKIIPKDWNDIVRANSHELEIRRASDDEIFQLHMDIQPGLIKSEINEWTLVCMNLLTIEQKGFVLIGDNITTGYVIRTSVVIGVDLDRGLVRTQSGSLYRIKNQATGIPYLEHLTAMCVYLYRCNLGEKFGVPMMFF